MLDLTQKKILVTGGHGFLGRYVVRALIQARGVPAENLLTPAYSDLDLRILENCHRVVDGVDVVFHLAANVGGIGLNNEKPGEIFYDNAIMGIQLMEAARHAAVQKMIVVSTTCAYPKTAPIPLKEEDLWNGYPDDITGSYGIVKKMLGVQGCAYAKQYGFNSIFLMPTNIYGPDDNFDLRHSHVIAALVKKFVDAVSLGDSLVEIWGSGMATREFIYVEDVAEGLISAAEKYDSTEPVNLGTGVEISIKNLSELIAEILDFQGEIRFDPTKPDGVLRRRLDTSKAKNAFGFVAGTTLREGLTNTIDWYRSNQINI